MASPQQSFVTQFGMAKESTVGTFLAPTTADQFLPAQWSSIHAADKYATLNDEGYRGVGAQTYGYYQGVGNSEISFETQVFGDVIGNPLMGIFGKDTISGAGPYSHLFALVAGYTPSYSVADYSGLGSGGQARGYASCFFSEVALKFSTSGTFTCTSKMQGFPSALKAKPTATYTTSNIVKAWQANLTLNSAANTRLTDFEITIKRNLDIVWGSGGSQTPAFIVPGRLSATGKMTFAAIDETDWLLYFSNTQPITSLVLSDSTTNAVTITCSKTAFMDPTSVERGKEYPQITASFECLQNTTDAGPLAVTVANSKSTAY